MEIYLDNNDLNAISTNELKEYLKTINPLQQIKITGNSTNHQILKQYIDQLKNCEIMKSFRHCIYFKNRCDCDYLEVQYDGTCKAYLDDEELSEEELKFYLDDEIERVVLYL